MPQIQEAGIPVTCLGQISRGAGGSSADSANALAVSNGLSRRQTTGVTAPRSLQAAASLPVAWWRLRQMQRTYDFALIHADMPLAGVLARLVGRESNTPTVYTEHNLIERYHPLTRWVHRSTFGWQSCILTVSEEVHASVRRAGGEAKTSVRTLLNGVPVQQVRSEAIRLEELRAELNICSSHQVVGSVAVFRTQKRLADWLAVAAEIARRQSAVTFLLVGDGPEMPMVQAKVRELGLEERIRLPGFREDGRRCLGLMDIFLMTSQFEGLPIALLEAMTLGKAVVATEVGGIPEVITDGHEGRLAPVGAIGSLAQHVEALLKDPAQSQRMGRHGAAKVETHYHIKHRVRAIEKVYAELLDAKVQPPGDYPDISHTGSR